MLQVAAMLLLLIGIPLAHASNHTVRFAVIGDYGGAADTSDHPLTAADPPVCASQYLCEGAVAKLVLSWKPDFIITVGDNNYEEGKADTIKNNIGNFYGDFITKDPTITPNRFFPSLGNHDWVPENAQPYVDYFTLSLQTTLVNPVNHDPDEPGNIRYYDVGIGQVHLFALDSDELEPKNWQPSTMPLCTGLSKQACWLKGRLADPSNAEPWKLVFFHYPPYSSGYNAWSTMQWGFPGFPSVDFPHVTAVLSGHDHFYERLITNGIPYFINGLGGYIRGGTVDTTGVPLFPFKNKAQSGIPESSIEDCVPGGLVPNPANSLCDPGSQKRYTADFGAMLVQATPTCINFQFIDRGGSQQDTYTLYKPSPNPPPNPPVDYYVRDWTDSPTSGDTGVVPSTHSDFHTTSDVWNRQSNDPGGFNANNQPQNEDPKNGPGAAGDNFAFARIIRNTCGNGQPATVTAHFLYSEFGTGSAYQDAGSAPDAQATFVADPLNAAADTVLHVTTGYPWHLPTTSSTHLCLAVQISAPSDPPGPTLLGYTPGWPTTDNMVINDNNTAQRNMGVYHIMKSGKWSFYAIAHNAATFRRSMTLRYEAPPEVLKSKVRLEIIDSKKMTSGPEGRLGSYESTPEIPKSGDTIILERMEPGENRWIGVTFESVEGKEGESLPVTFFEVVNNKAVNGFTIAPVPAPWPIVSRDILKFHASVFARLAALFGFAKAKEESIEASRVLQIENITEQDYVGLLRKHTNSMNDIVAELLKSQRSEDLFGIRVELKTVAAAIQEDALAPALAAHSTVLHKLDAFLTMLQKAKGDPADILQNVAWQIQLFRRLPEQKALECSTRPYSRRDKTHREAGHREAGDVEVESKGFIRAYETRGISNAAYPSLIRDLLPCFREAAKEFGGVVQLDEDIADMVKSLDSPVALQKAHHDYLLKLQNVVNKP